MTSLAARIAAARHAASQAAVRFKRSQAAGWLILGTVTGSLAAGFAWAAGALDTRLTPSEIVDRQQGAQPFAGFRRAHAKGICITGRFGTCTSL